MSETITPPEPGNRDSAQIRAYFSEVVLGAARQRPKPVVLEIGGGRDPMWSDEDRRELDASYWVNDVDEGELSLGPAWVNKLVGDICKLPESEIDRHRERFDVIFSRFVFEHVEDPARAYRSSLEMLKQGGAIVNVIPTLYATPFIINRLLPERLAARVLQFFFPNRTETGTPKFPAFYRWTVSTRRLERSLKEIGFSNVIVIPFFRHNYYDRIPVLGRISRRLSRIADTRDFRSGSTYAIVLAQR